MLMRTLPRGRALGLAATIVVLALAAYSVTWLTGSDAAGATDNQTIFGQEISPTAQAILADGEVTEQELLESLDAAHDCIAEKGYQPIRVDESTPPDERQVGYMISGSALASGKDDDASDCAERHHAAVARAYDSQHVPADTTRDEYMSEVLSCMEDKGFETNRDELGDRAAANDAFRNALVDCDSNAFR